MTISITTVGAAPVKPGAPPPMYLAITGILVRFADGREPVGVMEDRDVKHHAEGALPPTV